MGKAPSKVSENVWRSRSGEDWVAGYWNDDRAAHRDQIIAAIRTRFGAPDSVLDVGCNSGPNLRRFASEFSDCHLSGFDINAGAIAAGRRLFQQHGISVALSVGSLYDVLPRLPARSVDIVISSFVLAYVPPARLSGVLGEIIRVAQRGLILAEPHAFDSRRAGILTVPWYDWRHDYADQLAQLGIPRTRIEVFDLPDPGSANAGLLVADLQ